MGLFDRYKEDLPQDESFGANRARKYREEDEPDEADILRGAHTDPGQTIHELLGQQAQLKEQLGEANRLIKRLSSALNALPNKKLPANDGNFKDTYEAASAIGAYKRKYLKK